MNTKSLTRLAITLVLLTLAGPSPVQAQQSTVDQIETVRALYKGDREAVVREALALTEAEGAKFWPLYREYRADMERLGDGLVKLVLEYAELYPSVPPARAESLLRQYTSLEVKLAKKRAAYVHRAAKYISPAKALRWAQVENRADLALRLQLASVIPLAPTTVQPAP